MIKRNKLVIDGTAVYELDEKCILENPKETKEEEQQETKHK